MARKKINLKFCYDAPVTVTFSFICILIYILDAFLLKDFLANTILSAPTVGDGILPFSFSQVLSYPRLILYVFSSSSLTLLLINLIFILLLGPSIEEQYGSVVIGIMIAVSALFSGVLNACFNKEVLQGATAIVFMMIFLNGFMAFSKRKFPISFIVVLGLFITLEWVEHKSTGVIWVIINMAGGLCGSLLAFLTSPKARADNRYNKKVIEIDSKSPRYSKSKKSQSVSNDNDETIVGTLKF